MLLLNDDTTPKPIDAKRKYIGYPTFCEMRNKHLLKFCACVVIEIIDQSALKKIFLPVY